MSEENAPEVAHTATIKFGKGYDAPWLVLRAGTAKQLKQELLIAAGVTDPGMASLPLTDLIANVSMTAQVIWTTVQAMGGQVSAVQPIATATAATHDDPPFDPDPKPVAESASVTNSTPEPAEPAKPELGFPDEPVFHALNAVTSKEQFAEVWMAHKSEFGRTEVADFAKTVRARFA